MDKKTASSLLLATLQSTFLWGCICMVATIVFAVVAVMIHDVRWLLIFAWPFATFAVWEFARAFSKRRAINSGLDCHGGAFSRIFVEMALLGFGPD
jgi:hypothetical protein